MSNRIDVLDHGFVRLVSYMQPAEDAGFTQPGLGDMYRDWTGDLEIVRNARVSFDADWRTGTDEGSDDRLVRRLHARGHTSPFEAMVFTFEVQAPIFVFRQWHRHRTWSYNELSARYGVLPDLFYIPKHEQVGYQDPKEKQVRRIEGEVTEAQDLFVGTVARSSYDAYGAYNFALSQGIPREVARMLLPVNIYSRMFATVNLHNLFHFLRLRLDSHAQYEIRVYAEALLTLIRTVVPIATEAFKKSLGSELTAEEKAALIGSVSLDVDINGDDELSPEEEHDYDLLRSALEKLR